MSRSLVGIVLGPLVVSWACGVPPQEVREPARRTAAVLPYAVQVVAYRDYEGARAMAARMSPEFSGHPVYVVPERIQGLMYYKVYSGALTDTSEAAALRARLIDRGYLDEDEASDYSLIAYRPLAFDLGDFPTREAAEARAAELRQGAVPAYALAVPFSDGTERWTLYGGAFADSARAAPIGQMLEAKGIPARLVKRVGRPRLPGTRDEASAQLPRPSAPAPDAGPMPAIPAALHGCWSRGGGDPQWNRLIVTDSGLTFGGRSARPELIDSVSPRSVEGRFVAEENGYWITVATALELEEHGGRTFLVLREGDAGSDAFSRCAA